MLFHRCSHTPRLARLLLPAVAALLVLGACSDEANLPDQPAAADPSGADSPAGGTPPDGNGTAILPFTDEFDDDEHGWGGPHHRFEAGDYVWNVPPGQTDVRAADTLIRAEDDIDDIVVTTSFTAVGMTAVGLQCAFEEREGSSRWYELELSVDGVSIRKRPFGNAPAETLSTNPSITLTERSTELVAECRQANGRYLLTLAVDGVVAAEAVDAQPFGRAGAPNLMVRAAPDVPASAEHVVQFHRFTVTEYRPA
jgi:hypothetical protein